MLSRLRAQARVAEMRALSALNLGHRYTFHRKRDFYSERAAILWERATHVVACHLLNDHHVRFGTAPRCMYCGRVPR